MNLFFRTNIISCVRLYFLLRFIFEVKNINLCYDEKNILENIKKIRDSLRVLENKLNYETNNDLIDSYIYEIKALQTRYKFYIDLCKEKKIRFMNL